tara:strand:- start:1153 stop:1902 length:750 start_codon:yes stop_codon:yes gene_type:complete
MSTYLDFAIKDKTELCQWIERKLGAPLVRVELTQEHLDDAIDEAMEIYTKYVTPEKKYFSIDLEQFPLSGLTMAPNVAGIFALEGDADFGGGGAGTLFSTRSSLSNNIGINNGSTGNWITYELAGQYLELTKRLTGGGYQFEYNYHTKLLNLDPNPGLSGNSDHGFLVVGANVIRPETEQFGEYWVKRYALALSKITLGYIRSKFQGVALLAGGQIDGDGIKAEGIQERDELMEELMSSEYLPVTFFVG